MLIFSSLFFLNLNFPWKQNRTINSPIVIKILEQLFILARLGHEVDMALVPSQMGIQGHETEDKSTKEVENGTILNTKIPYTDLKLKLIGTLQIPCKMHGTTVKITNYSQLSLSSMNGDKLTPRFF